jgi:tRNA modification GTPase
MRELFDDTIIAISTPLGFSGLGIVRMSGPRALGIARAIFKPRRTRWSDLPARSLILGDICRNSGKEPLDEGYLAYFPAPRSYTRENMVEISCHGSPLILEEVVRLAIRGGARQADPGEFTLRAFLNGRIDILQAEAVNDLITAASLRQARISFGQVRGRLSRRLASIRSRVVQVLSLVEAALEFPEEELPVSTARTARTLESAAAAVRKLIDSYDTGRALAEGLNLAIVGRANVGKSTLFNALLDEDRAIVSPYPGTTRDYLRERIKIGDSIFHLTDMAGLDRPSHPVEEEGIQRSRRLASQADAVLLVVDASRPESPADLKLIKKYGSKASILLFNKCDLPNKVDREKCRSVFQGSRFVDISALRKTNLEGLKKMIKAAFIPAESEDHEIILHLRQKLLLEQVLGALEESLRLLRQGHSEEVWAEEIRRALPYLGRLTGEIRSDEVIAEIFNRFCVGK